MTFTDIYFQPDAPDPVLDEQTVREAARRHAPHAGRLLQVDESGGEARAYHLEGDIVLKTQRPHRLRPRTSLAKEEFVLRALERAGDLPVPRVLGYGHAQGIEYLCLTRMPGASLRNIELKPPQRAPAPSTPSSTPKAAASAASSTSATPTAATPHSTCAPGTTKRTHTPYSPATSHPAPYPRASNTSGAPGS
jgi:hypothetical protein